MNRKTLAAAFAVLLAGVLLMPIACAEPTDEDQVFFDQLQQSGLHPDAAKQVCGSAKCESLGTILVEEAHVVCSSLGVAPKVVPVSVIANLQVSPSDAHAVIEAARSAYCPQSPDPYTMLP
ncbi:DUF732 domain-containing protein [[Mycobacterium] zoologicum]|uniref:DUF732 domain-containing protein n=1 Tax=[Mycobacterium] zoologicum TaxID=2872311 RepID=UPI001CDB32FD|nr:DUF732 domain-containing protein [Mycolicibacter sp. MYC101]MEB3065456.1 DUF732 domain-containing protein [Mycolicibacter sp. MYC101]